MPDFNDRGPEFRGEMPPPPFGHGPMMPGDELYYSGAHFGPSVGTEKNKDETDEKVKLENIREIPRYAFVKRFKAWRTYRKYYAGFNRIKESMYWDMTKLNRIDTKLQKYENYPDDVINRDKLIKDKNRLQNRLLSCQKELTEISRIKLQSYAKALGYEMLPDDAFEILDPLKKTDKKDSNEKVKSQEVKPTHSVEKENTKEKEVTPVTPVVENKEEKATINTKTNTNKSKNKHHRSSTKKNKSVNNSSDTASNTNTEKLLKLYNLLVEKYGREDAKKYLENFIEQERRKSNVDELNEMLNDSYDNSQKNSVRK